MMRIQAAFLTIAFALSALPVHGLSQPRQPALPLESSIYLEPLEVFQIPRLRLSGRQTMQMDVAEFLEVSRSDNGESFALQQRFFPDNRFSIYLYPNSAISGGISQASVAKYVQDMKGQADRQGQYFEIIEMPQPPTAPAKIRYLGAKPFTTLYSFNRKINGKPTPILVLDSWAQLGDYTYLVRVEAPADRFDTFFRQVKSVANTLHFIE